METEPTAQNRLWDRTQDERIYALLLMNNPEISPIPGVIVTQLSSLMEEVALGVYERVMRKLASERATDARAAEDHSAEYPSS